MPPSITDPLKRATEGEKRYAAAFVNEAGQLDKANGRTIDTINIFETCEKRMNEARQGK